MPSDLSPPKATPMKRGFPQEPAGGSGRWSSQSEIWDRLREGVLGTFGDIFTWGFGFPIGPGAAADYQRRTGEGGAAAIGGAAREQYGKAGEQAANAIPNIPDQVGNVIKSFLPSAGQRRDIVIYGLAALVFTVALFGIFLGGGEAVYSGVRQRTRGTIRRSIGGKGAK